MRVEILHLRHLSSRIEVQGLAAAHFQVDRLVLCI